MRHVTDVVGGKGGSYLVDHAKTGTDVSRWNLFNQNISLRGIINNNVLIYFLPNFRDAKKTKLAK